VVLDTTKTPYQVSENVLNNILSTKTAGITFSQILFSKNEIKTTDPKKAGDVSILEIHGVANNRDSLRNFKTALDNNPNFSEVNLPISNFLEKSDLIFTVSLKIK
jgi:hypothetical protein